MAPEPTSHEIDPIHNMKHVGFYNRWTSGTGHDAVILEDMNGHRWISYGDNGVLVRWPLADEFPKVWPKDALNPEGLPYPLPASGPHRG